MDNFAPGLREAVLTVADALRVVVYFVCVVGLMLSAQGARANVEGLVRPIVRAVVIAGLVATLPHWFEFTERVFLGVADTVLEGYTQHPMQTAARLREAASSDTEFSLRRIGESLYRAFLDGSMKLVVLVGSVLQVPFLLMQFVLKLLCYLFLPVALACFLVPALAGTATRYLQQTLAVLAWPVGFAVTELVAYHLLTGYGSNLATAYGLAPGEIDAASFGSLLGAVVAALWIIIGTVATPFLMQGLFCSGSPLSGGGSTALHQLYALQQLTYMVKTLKTGGLAAPALATGLASAKSPGGSTLPPPPPPPPATPPAPPATPPSPAPDPAGDARAAAALATAQLPAPQTTL
jgi:hypothetical protein